jgi:copper chaperone CopZ
MRTQIRPGTRAATRFDRAQHQLATGQAAQRQFPQGQFAGRRLAWRGVCLSAAVGLFALVSIAASGCARAEASGVRTVEAKIDGITCPTCIPPLTKALRRQFSAATAVDVSDETKTATVTWDKKQEFSPAAFNEAVGHAKMRVLGYRIEACGRVEASGSERWLTAGSNRFLVRGAADLPLNQPICVNGSLDASHDPATLDVASVKPQTAAQAGP